MAGHLFVVDGDLTRIACDAVLVPVDEDWWVETPAFGSLLGMSGKGPVPEHPAQWPGNGMWLFAPGSTAPDGSFAEPDVWVGDVGRQGLPDSSHFAERARAFVTAAVPVVRERLLTTEKPTTRRPLVCLNVLGSGAGGKRSQRGQLVEALVPELVNVATETDTDVVLVCFGQIMYSAVQAARRRLPSAPGGEGWEDFESELHEEAQKLAHLARDGRLVLFMGAGVSVDAGIPAWKPLLESLAVDLLRMSGQKLKAFSDLDARDQAVLIERRTSRRRFREALHSKMQSSRHGLAHALLSSLPCSETVTTNFDELFEHACEGPGRTLSVIPGGEVRSGERWLLKLHGTLGGDLVFTRSDYLNATSSHAALRGIVQAMLLTRHMLFIGYSLADEDFNQLVHEVRKASGGGKATLGTALFPESNPHLRHLWPDLNIVSPKTRGLDFAEQVRRLWVAIDWIGMQSSSHVAHLADDSFGQMRTDVEVELSDLVARLSDFRSRVDDASGAGWHELDEFLKHFGSHE